MTQRDIAIVGAGIGGLAFAALAARAGQCVRVFDQFEAPRPVGSGLVIQPVGQAVLEACGAGSALRLGRRIDRMLGQEARRGRAVLDVTYDPARGERFGLAIHRASLHHALLEAALAAGAELVPGHRVTGRAGQRLCVGDQRLGPFDLIVDASGARSALSPLMGKPLSFGALWGTVPWQDTALRGNMLSQRYSGADRMAGILPIGRLPGDETPLATLFWSVKAKRIAALKAAPLSDWKAEVKALWPETAPFLACIESHQDLTFAQYEHGTLIRPASEGIAHIGDAAHRASPQLGQGANMALLDAMALWRALDGQHHLPDALMRYVKARRWHIWAYQAMSAAFTPQYQSDRWLPPRLRDWALAPLSKVPPLPRILSRLVCGDLLPPYGALAHRPLCIRPLASGP